MDYSQVADVITQHAAPGDCLIMDNTATWKPGPIRPLTAARAAATKSSSIPVAARVRRHGTGYGTRTWGSGG